MSSNITSANATAVMIINDLFPVGFAVEGFATDKQSTKTRKLWPSPEWVSMAS